MTDTIQPLGGPVILTRQSKAPKLEDIAETETLGFLCFKVDGKEFGIDLNLIQKIVKPPPLTRVPRMPDHILGIISIRGAVVTLVDLRQRMDLAPAPWPKTARVLIVEMVTEQIGLLVDEVTIVRRIVRGDLELKPQLMEGARDNFVSFVARPSGTPVFMLDLDTILNERMQVR